MFNRFGRAVRALALVAALVMTATVFAACGSAVDSNPAVAKVGDVEISYAAYANTFQNYANYGLIDVSTADKLAEARNTIFDMLIDSALPIAAAKAQGLTLTEEEKAAALATADETMASYLEEYLDATIEDETARKDAAIKAFNKDYKSSGYTYSKLYTLTQEDSIDQALGTKLSDQAKSAAGTATDAEIEEYYNTKLEEDRASYAEKPENYYSDQSSYSWYGAVRPLVAPEGYFYVKHILLKAPEADSTENTVTEEGTQSTSTASFGSGEVDLDAKAAEIMKKIEAGEDFDALIEEYNQDTGEGEQGYLMSESIKANYDAAFADAALALKKEGDVSEPVTGSNGVHIIKRLGDVSADPIPLADVKEEIASFLNAQKQNEAYTAALEEWRGQVAVTKYEKRVQYVGVN